MVRTRPARILYFRTVAHKAACHTPSKALLKPMKTRHRLSRRWRHFSHRMRPKIRPVALPPGGANKIVCFAAIYIFQRFIKSQRGFSNAGAGYTFYPLSSGVSILFGICALDRKIVPAFRSNKEFEDPSVIYEHRF